MFLQRARNEAHAVDQEREHDERTINGATDATRRATAHAPRTGTIKLRKPALTMTKP